MRKLFKNGRYANVTASLALFVALGGTSYAALTLPANSVSTKQIKKGAVTLNRLSAGARTSLKGHTGARGPAGAQGPAGPPGLNGSGAGSSLWAAVTQPGNLARHSHATDAALVATTTSTYRVVFDRDVSNCVYTTTVGGLVGSGDDQTLPGLASAARRDPGHLDTVEVDTYNTGGGASPRPFYLVVHC